MEKRVSEFAVIGKAKGESGDYPFAGVDDAKMESFMADMEREMGSMNEENLDPRQLGHFMRKMTEMMGDKTPPSLLGILKNPTAIFWAEICCGQRSMNSAVAKAKGYP